MTPTVVLPFFFLCFSPAKKKEKIQNFSSKKNLSRKIETQKRVGV